MIYAILGPTCSGKSDLAEEISLKKNCPVINFDAFQVYKEINKGTAKPDEELLNSNRYFLYGFKSIKEDYNISLYQNDGRKLLEKFKNQDVVLVGGSGLYLKALLFDYNLLEEDPMPENYKSDVSNEILYEELLKIDSEDALKIGKNNRKRLLRAHYVYETHKKSKTELNDNGKNKLLYDDVIFIGLDIDREILYKNINKRVDLMFENGLKEEVDELFNKFDKSLRAFQAIGYKEFLLSDDIELVKEKIKLNTRRYAKRQFTFFKHQFDNVNWFKTKDEALNFVLGEENGNRR